MIINPQIILSNLSAQPAVSGEGANGNSQGIDFARMLMQSLRGLNNQHAQDSGTSETAQSPISKAPGNPGLTASSSITEGKAEMVEAFFTLPNISPADSACTENPVVPLSPAGTEELSGAVQMLPFQLEIVNAEGKKESFPVYILPGAKSPVHGDDSTGGELAGPIFIVIPEALKPPRLADSASGVTPESGDVQNLPAPGEISGSGFSETEKQLVTSPSDNGEIGEFSLKKIFATLVSRMQTAGIVNPPGVSADSTKALNISEIPNSGQVSKPEISAAPIHPENGEIRPEFVIVEGKLNPATSNGDFHPGKKGTGAFAADLSILSQSQSPAVEENAEIKVPQTPKAISSSGKSESGLNREIYPGEVSVSIKPSVKAVEYTGLTASVTDIPHDIPVLTGNAAPLVEADLESAPLTGKVSSASLPYSLYQFVQDPAQKAAMTNFESALQGIFAAGNQYQNSPVDYSLPILPNAGEGEMNQNQNSFVLNPSSLVFSFPTGNSSETEDRLTALLKEIASSGGKIKLVFTPSQVKPQQTGETPSPDAPSVPPSNRIKNMVSGLAGSTKDTQLPGNMTAGTGQTAVSAGPEGIARPVAVNVPVSDSNPVFPPVSLSVKTIQSESIPRKDADKEVIPSVETAPQENTGKGKIPSAEPAPQTNTDKGVIPSVESLPQANTDKEKISSAEPAPQANTDKGKIPSVEPLPSEIADTGKADSLKSLPPVNHVSGNTPPEEQLPSVNTDKGKTTSPESLTQEISDTGKADSSESYPPATTDAGKTTSPESLTQEISNRGKADSSESYPPANTDKGGTVSPETLPPENSVQEKKTSQESMPHITRLVRITGNTVAQDAPEKVTTLPPSGNTSPAAPAAEKMAVSEFIPLLSRRMEGIIQRAAFISGKNETPAPAVGNTVSKAPTAPVQNPVLDSNEMKLTGIKIQEHEIPLNNFPKESSNAPEMKWPVNGKNTDAYRVINRGSPESGSPAPSSETISAPEPVTATGFPQVDSAKDIGNIDAPEATDVSNPELSGGESFITKTVSVRRTMVTSLQEPAQSTVSTDITVTDEALTAMPLSRPPAGPETDVKPGTVSIKAPDGDPASFSGGVSDRPLENKNIFEASIPKNSSEAPIPENKNAGKEPGFPNHAIPHTGKSAVATASEVSETGLGVTQSDEPGAKEKTERSHSKKFEKSSPSPSPAAGLPSRNLPGISADTVSSVPRPLFELQKNINGVLSGDSADDSPLGGNISPVTGAGNQISEDGSIIIPGMVNKSASTFETAKKTSIISTSRGVLNYREIGSGIINSVVQHARIMLQKNMSSATIHLEPPSLGKLKMSIVTEDSKVTGKIFVESREVQQIIQNNISDLRQNLAQNGLMVESFDVQLGHNGGTDGWGQRENLESTAAYLRSDLKNSTSALADSSTENAGRRYATRSSGIIDIWM
jgi:hypothetical protein